MYNSEDSYGHNLPCFFIVPNPAEKQDEHPVNEVDKQQLLSILVDDDG